MIVIGIDPGVTGALGLVKDDRLLHVLDIPAERMSRTSAKQRVACAQLADLLRAMRQLHGDEDFMAVVELVNAMPPIGGQRRAGTASSFSLGDTAGAIRGVLQTMRIRIEYVTPGAWKKSMKVDGKEGKELALTIARQRWPEQAHYFARKKDHNRAEASLIAAYGWRMFA